MRIDAADPGCRETWRNDEYDVACGVGAELSLILALLGGWARGKLQPR